MKERTVYFDIDGLLTDSKKLASIHKAALLPLVGAPESDFSSAVDDYYRNRKRTEFDPVDFTALLSDRFAVGQEVLLAVYEDSEPYKEAFYNDAFFAFENISKLGNEMGAYSEAANPEHQMRKIAIPGATKFMEKGSILILANKTTPESIALVGNGIVVDDKVEVVEAVKTLTKEGAIPILVDREGNKSASGVEEIGDLTELPDLVKKL